MKMAKASERDLEMANDLAGMLESFERGYFPLLKDNDDSDEPQESRFFDRDDGRHCVEAMEMILDALRRGSLFRVTFGMLLLLDPRNEVVDPALSHIEHHPEAKWAREQRGELVEALRAVMGTTIIRNAQGFMAKGFGTKHPDGIAIRTAETTLDKEAAFGLFRYLSGGAFA